MINLPQIYFFGWIQTYQTGGQPPYEVFEYLGGSPGLVVMGGDTRSKGCGFESQRRILDGHDIFHIDLL